MPETITHATLARLVAAGVVRGAHVRREACGWIVLVRCGRTEHVLAAGSDRRARLFRNLETLAPYLCTVGIFSFTVDAADRKPDELSPPGRADRVTALRREGQPTDHDRSFRKCIEIAVNEGDDPVNIWASNEEAQRRRDRRRAELAAHAERGRKPFDSAAKLSRVSY